jgi:hypothetical protein
MSSNHLPPTGPAASADSCPVSGSATRRRRGRSALRRRGRGRRQSGRESRRRGQTAPERRAPRDVWDGRFCGGDESGYHILISTLRSRSDRRSRHRNRTVCRRARRLCRRTALHSTGIAPTTFRWRGEWKYSTRSAMTRSHRRFHDLWLPHSFVTHPLSAGASTTPETSTDFSVQKDQKKSKRWRRPIDSKSWPCTDRTAIVTNRATYNSGTYTQYEPNRMIQIGF